MQGVTFDLHENDTNFKHANMYNANTKFNIKYCGKLIIHTFENRDVRLQHLYSYTDHQGKRLPDH